MRRSRSRQRRRRRSVPVDEKRLKRVRDDRDALQVRRSIFDHVDVEHDGRPRALWREVLIEAIVVLDDGRCTRQTCGELDEIRLRQWLADVADVDDYDPRDDRGIHFRREELQQIEQALEEGT